MRDAWHASRITATQPSFVPRKSFEGSRSPSPYFCFLVRVNHNTRSTSIKPSNYNIFTLGRTWTDNLIKVRSLNPPCLPIPPQGPTNLLKTACFAPICCWSCVMYLKATQPALDRYLQLLLFVASALFLRPPFAFKYKGSNLQATQTLIWIHGSSWPYVTYVRSKSTVTLRTVDLLRT